MRRGAGSVPLALQRVPHLRDSCSAVKGLSSTGSGVSRSSSWTVSSGAWPVISSTLQAGQPGHARSARSSPCISGITMSVTTRWMPGSSPAPQRLRSRPRLQHPIALRPQHPRRQPPHPPVVIHDQHRPASRGGGPVRSPSGESHSQGVHVTHPCRATARVSARDPRERNDGRCRGAAHPRTGQQQSRTRSPCGSAAGNSPGGGTGACRRCARKPGRRDRPSARSRGSSLRSRWGQRRLPRCSACGGRPTRWRKASSSSRSLVVDSTCDQPGAYRFSRSITITPRRPSRRNSTARPMTAGSRSSARWPSPLVRLQPGPGPGAHDLLAVGDRARPCRPGRG